MPNAEKKRPAAKRLWPKLAGLLAAVLVLAIGLANLQVFRYSFSTLSSFQGNNASNPLTPQEPILIHFTTRYRHLTAVAVRFSAAEDAKLRGKGLTLELTDAGGQTVARLEVDLSAPGAFSQFHRLALPGATDKNQSYSLAITTTSLTRDDAIRINTGAWDGSHVTGWSWGAYQEPDAPELALEYLRFSLPNFFAFLLVLLLAAALLFVPPFKKQGHRLAWQLGLLAVVPLAVLAATELLNKNSIFSLSLPAILLNYGILLTAELLLFALGNRFPAAVIGGSGLVLAGAVANHYVLLFRHTVLLPTDLFSVVTATNVISKYDFSITLPVLFAIALWLAICCAAAKNAVVIKGPVWRLGWGGGALAALALTVFIYASPSRLAPYGIAPDYFSQSSSSTRNGFYLNFALNASNLAQQKPDGYDPAALAAQMPPGTAGDGSRPHIILIMNESLADFSLFGNTRASNDPLPFIHSLAQDTAAHVGSLVVPTFGANTSSTEFEALAQFSLSLNYRTLTPFSQYVHAEVPALPAYLARLGYRTLGTHPAPATSWERERTYPLLGFDDATFIDAYDGRDIINTMVSDAGMYSYLTDYFEANREAPLFLFGVTLQNHGGYSYIPEVEPGELIRLPEGYGSAATYLSMIAQSDRAFQGLVEYFAAVDEPVMILMFGDHLPGVSVEYYELLFGKAQSDMTAEERMDYYTTPLVAWSNYGADFSSLPGLMSSHYLGSHIKQAAGLPLSPLDVFQLQLAASWPVLGGSGTVDAAGSYSPSPQDTVPQELLRQYACLQYNALFDTAGRLDELYAPGG